MLEPAADLGSALCRSLDALGLAAPSACGDPSGVVTIGCVLLLGVGAGFCALFVSERFAVSDFVRRAIEERTERRALTLSRDPPA